VSRPAENFELANFSTSISLNVIKRVYALTLSRETKSAACRRVSPEISSTILLSFVSAAPGGGLLDEDWVSVVRHLRANRTGAYARGDEDVEGAFAGTRAREKRDVENDLLQHDACLPEGSARKFVMLGSYIIDHCYDANRPRRELGQSESGKEAKTLAPTTSFGIPDRCAAWLRNGRYD
jgi:hypothetical protein